MLTVLAVVSNTPVNPRFATLALKLLAMSVVPAFVFAAVAQVFSSSSTFKNKFYFLLYICNLIVGGFIFCSATYGGLRELGMLPK